MDTNENSKDCTSDTIEDTIKKEVMDTVDIPISVEDPICEISKNLNK